MHALHASTPTLRRNRIAELLRERPRRSQEELRRTLEREGIEVTQATLSRDLRSLGVVKTPSGYALPAPSAPPPAPGVPSELERLWRMFLVHADSVGNVAVLKTSPGNAHGLGVALDRSAFEGIVGCIAGDDTVFALARDAAAARRLVRAALAAARL
ncbi:MAG TPA: arginine repressor [Planctomycetota bacterium]|jgi:transcriptional regulator of arginine metabolism|nr:arginine repressor [Planctomycetota bacterium]